jgi:signal peptide peptidase SppA
VNKLQLIELLQQPFCMLPEYANGYLSVVSSILNSNQTVDQDFSEERKNRTPLMVSDSGAVTTGWDFSKAESNSVAILRVKGPIMKDSEFCGPVGTAELAQKIYEIENNPNIVGTVLRIESGGGAVNAIKPIADAIAKSNKPIIAVAEDVMASAAYYIASYCNEIFADNPRSIIGSIGAMMSIMDIKPALEKQGVKFHEIYATASTNKNKDFNEVLKGNYQPVINKQLDPLNEDFINAVKANRSGRISTSENLIYTGETFFATVAKELGMIDQLGNTADAIARVRELAAHNTTSPINNQNNMKFENVAALNGVAAPTAEQLDLANADLTTEGITGVTLVEETFIIEAAQVTSDLAAAKATIEVLTTAKTTAETALATSTQSIESKEASIVALTEKVEAFGKNAGSTHSQKTGEDTPPEGAPDTETILAGLAHNRAADRTLNA